MTCSSATASPTLRRRVRRELHQPRRSGGVRPRLCPCGAGCANQRFQKKQYAKLDIARTGRKGHGLFTKQPLRKKEFIIEYIGEVLHEDVYRARKQRYEEEGRRHYYFMTLSSSETIDAAERGNAGGF